MDIKVCRICGCASGLKNINEDCPEMKDKLVKCANIRIYPGDLLPKLICATCDKNLDLFYRLRKKSEETQKLLKREFKRQQNEQLGEERVFNMAKDKYKDKDAIMKCKDDQSMGSEENNSENETFNRSDDGFDNEKAISEIKIPNESIEFIKEKWIPNYEITTVNDHERAGLTVCDIGNNKQQFMSLENESKDNDNDGNICENEISVYTKQRPAIMELYSIDLLTSSSRSELSESYNDFYNDKIEPELYETNPLTCDTCHEVFTTKKDYSAHIKQHGKERFQCIQCCKFFPTRYGLKRHEEIHFETKSYQCSRCDRCYSALHNLQRHIRTIHSVSANSSQFSNLNINILTCTICNAAFSRVDSLRRHLQLHSAQTYTCLLCSKSFKIKDYLTTHIRTVHEQKSGSTKNLKRTTTSNTSRYQCGYCGKLFKSSFPYKNHLLIHTNEKPHECGTCNTKFRTIAALKTHERIHNGCRPYQCDLCLKRFKQSSHLNEHKLLHSSNALKHSCSICHALFAKKSNLKVHMRIHINEKPLKCAECSGEFTFMHLLQKHIKRVHQGITSNYNLNKTTDMHQSTNNNYYNRDISKSELCHISTIIEDDFEHNLEVSPAQQMQHSELCTE